MSTSKQSFSEAVRSSSMPLVWAAALTSVLALSQAVILIYCIQKFHAADALIERSSSVNSTLADSDSQLAALASAPTADTQTRLTTDTATVSTDLDGIRSDIKADSAASGAFSDADTAEPGWIAAVGAVTPGAAPTPDRLAYISAQSDVLRAGLEKFSDKEVSDRESSAVHFEAAVWTLSGMVVLGLILAFVLGNSAQDEVNEVHEHQVKSATEQVDGLKRRNAVLSTTLDGMSEAVVAVDNGGAVIYLNPAAEKLTGWQEVDAVSRPIGSIVALKHESTSTEVPSPTAQVIKDCVGHELPASTIVESRTGAKVPVEGASTPIWRGEQVTGAVLILRDSSERRAARHSQRASESLKEAIIESSLDCVVLIDKSGKIVEFNPAATRTFGTGRAAMIGKSFFETALAPDQGAKLAFSFQKAAAQGVNDILDKRLEVNALKGDGSQFPAEFAVTEIPGQVPQVFAAYLRDISDRRAAQAAMVQAKEEAQAESREKSLFLADMSDELRTPLNAVIGYTEMLQEEAEDRKLHDLLPDLEKIHGAGRHLNSLIGDILDLSRIEAGKMQLYVENFAVDDLLNDVDSAIKPMLIKNKNVLEIKRSNVLGEMNSDRIKLRQGLINLLSNASRFTSNRKLLLEATREKKGGIDWLTFRVTDVTGEIPPEETERLAEAFAEGASASRARFGGSGLGLVIVRHFCEMMGGHIISKRNVGHSATFGMQVPAIVKTS